MTNSFIVQGDWSRGWAYRYFIVSNPECWGVYLILDGPKVVRLYRGSDDSSRFYDSLGEQVGPEHINISAALAAAHKDGWVSLKQ